MKCGFLGWLTRVLAGPDWEGVRDGLKLDPPVQPFARVTVADVKRFRDVRVTDCGTVGQRVLYDSTVIERHARAGCTCDVCFAITEKAGGA